MADPATGEPNAEPVVPQTPDVDGPDPEGADALGDAGKKALNTMKAERNAERAARQAAEAELAKFKNAPPVDIDAITADVTAKVTTAANERALAAAVKAVLKKRTVDAGVAFQQMDLSGLDAVDIDPDQIDQAINGLLENKPYLAAATAPRFQGSGDGGAQGRKASGPAQLTRDELKGMTPAQIAQARADGRLKTLLGE